VVLDLCSLLSNQYPIDLSFIIIITILFYLNRMHLFIADLKINIYTL